MRYALLEVDQAGVVIRGNLRVGEGPHAGQVREALRCFRLPPAVWDTHQPLRHASADEGAADHTAGRGLNPRPVAFFKPKVIEVCLVDEQRRITRTLSEIRDVSVSGTVVLVVGQADEHGERILVAPGRRFAVVRQGIEAEIVQDGRVEFHLAGRGRETRLLVFLLGVLHPGQRAPGDHFGPGRVARLQAEVEHLLGSLPGELVFEAHAARELVPEINDALAFAGRLHRLIRHADHHAGALQPRVARQHVVGELCGRGHHVFVGDDQILLHQTFIDAPGVGEGHQRIVAQGEKGAYRVRVGVGHGLEHRHRVCHVAAADEVGVTVSPHFLGLVVHRRHTAVGEYRELTGTELLVLLRLWQTVVQFYLGVRADSRVEASEHLTTLHVQIARQRAQGALQTDR